MQGIFFSAWGRLDLLLETDYYTQTDAAAVFLKKNHHSKHDALLLFIKRKGRVDVSIVTMGY